MEKTSERKSLVKLHQSQHVGAHTHITEQEQTLEDVFWKGSLNWEHIFHICDRVCCCIYWRSDHLCMHCARMNYWPFSFRLQERLKRKDPVQTRLEQLEKGFSLYVNGANSELRKYRRKITPHLRNRSNATRTKGECHGSLAELHHRGHCDPGTAPLEPVGWDSMGISAGAGCVWGIVSAIPYQFFTPSLFNPNI